MDDVDGAFVFATEADEEAHGVVFPLSRARLQVLRVAARVGLFGRGGVAELGVDKQRDVVAGEDGHDPAEFFFAGGGEFVDAGGAHEGFDAEDSEVDEFEEGAFVAGDEAGVEADVDVDAIFGGGEFLLECLGGWW